MSSIDWQSYEDQTMDKATREDVDSLLRKDQALREELAGFRAFREALQTSALGQEVPIDRLNQSLRNVVQSANVRPQRVRYIVAFAAAAVALFAVFRIVNHDPLALATTPEITRIEANDTLVAANWINNTTPFHISPPSAPAGAVVVSARRGSNWACIDFEMQGATYHLYIAKDVGKFENAQSTARAGKEFFVGKGVGWTSDGHAFYVRGGNEVGRWRLAIEASSIR